MEVIIIIDMVLTVTGMGMGIDISVTEVRRPAVRRGRRNVTLTT
jgi:hypothetical protein